MFRLPKNIEAKECERGGKNEDHQTDTDADQKWVTKTLKKHAHYENNKRI